MNKTNTEKKTFTTENIAKIAILTAFATIIYLLEFNLPFFPGFYKMDLSAIVVLIGGFSMGPLAAVSIEFLKLILNLLINGTATHSIGEISNFFISCCFVIPAILIYQRNKTKKNAVIGLGVGTFSLVVVGSLLNYYVLIPAYCYFMGWEMEAIIGMASKANSAITSLPRLIFFGTTPFNLLKGVVCSLVTALLYKRLSPILHRNYSKKA